MAFDPVSFGRTVAAARARLGLKPKELAAKMGVNPATVYRIERGERADIGRPQLEALARGLESTPEELLGVTSMPAASADDLELRDLVARNHDELVARLDAIAEQLRVLSARRESSLERR